MTSNELDKDWLEKEEALARLTGARLTSVQFVLSYLILGFDEKGALTTLVWPELVKGETRVEFGTQGYRDALCALIEKTAVQVTIERDETISIDFEEATEMRIPLQSYKGAGERAILTGPRHYLCVF
ncbi:MAG: hypothetical protein ACJ8IR_03435 [Alphaproteobacteria bacterium]|jgi:hypothetical protein